MNPSDLVYGAHMSIADGFLKAAEKAHQEYHANALQIFLKSPRGRKEKMLSDAEAEAFRSYCSRSDIRFVVGHCSYLLNFAKDLGDDPWPVESLSADLQKIHRLGGAGVILHIGKYLEQSQEEALRYLAHNLPLVLDQTKAEGNFVILENTAGQGTEIGWQFVELERVYKKELQGHPRVRFCLDTAHAFAAGYDLRDAKSVAKVFGEFDGRFGLHNLVVIHLNDSQKGLGSRVDRHANLGKGEIGKEGLVAVIHFAIEHKIPMILETPEDDNGSHLPDLEVMRSWLSLG